MQGSANGWLALAIYDPITNDAIQINEIDRNLSEHSPEAIFNELGNTRTQSGTRHVYTIASHDQTVAELVKEWALTKRKINFILVTKGRVPRIFKPIPFTYTTIKSGSRGEGDQSFSISFDFVGEDQLYFDSQNLLHEFVNSELQTTIGWGPDSGSPPLVAGWDFNPTLRFVQNYTFDLIENTQRVQGATISGPFGDRDIILPLTLNFVLSIEVPEFLGAVEFGIEFYSTSDQLIATNKIIVQDGINSIRFTNHSNAYRIKIRLRFDTFTGSINFAKYRNPVLRLAGFQDDEYIEF